MLNEHKTTGKAAVLGAGTMGARLRRTWRMLAGRCCCSILCPRN